MELAKELIREIILDRSSFGPLKDAEQHQRCLEAAVKEAEIFMVNGLSIAVHILLGHDQCKSKQSFNCKACCEVEVWTVQVSTLLGGEMTGKPPIFPTFLKQAVRSQLHFSPTKSWFSGSENTPNVAQNYKCVYRVSTSSYFQNEKGDGLHLKKIDQHKFPPCKLDEKLISIDVKWLKKENFPTKIIKCPSKIIDDQVWVSPDRCFNDCIDNNEAKVLSRKNSKETRSLGFQPTSASNIGHEWKSIRDKRSNNIVVERPEQPPGERMHNTKRDFNGIPQFAANYKIEASQTSIPEMSPKIADKPRMAMHKKLFHRALDRTPSPYARTRTVNRTPSRLLCNFEESVLKGCLRPIHVVEGFKLQLAITANTLVTKHITIPVTTSYFSEELSSLYMSNCTIPSVISNSKCKPGIQILRQCTLQAVLFNTQDSVVKIFLLNIDVSDMPPLSQTFIRQRTHITSNKLLSTNRVPTTKSVATLPVSSSHSSRSLGFNSTGSNNNTEIARPTCARALQPKNGVNYTGTTSTSTKRDNPTGSTKSENTALKFLIHVRLLSDHRGRVFIHGDIKMLLSNKGGDLEGLVSTQTESATQMPQFPKYSPIK